MNQHQIERAKELAQEGNSDLSHAEIEHLVQEDGTIRFKLWAKGTKIPDQNDANTIKDCRISRYGQVLPLGSKHGVVL